MLIKYISLCIIYLQTKLVESIIGEELGTLHKPFVRIGSLDVGEDNASFGLVHMGRVIPLSLMHPDDALRRKDDQHRNVVLKQDTRIMIDKNKMMSVGLYERCCSTADALQLSIFFVCANPMTKKIGHCDCSP